MKSLLFRSIIENFFFETFPSHSGQVMSVVGIDFGTQSCYIAVARTGGIETIDNDYSDRCTPNYVSFGENVRAMGNSAKNQCITNFRNTIYSYKELLGRPFSDEQVKVVQERVPYKIIENKGQALIEVQYRRETNQYTPLQITAMMLMKLKETAEVALKAKVVDCVVSVPATYTDMQRRAMLDACQTVNLNCLRIMNDTTATALAYGIYKQDLPEETESRRVVVFVDMGYAHLQVSACAFNKGKLKMLGISKGDVGGRDFDGIIVDHFVSEFKKQYKVDASTNKKALIRLTHECEKLKKQLSVNIKPSPFNLECFMDDKDVSGKLDRPTFEEMCGPLLHVVENTFKALLTNCDLKPSDLHSVEIVGGASRIHSIKKLVKSVFGIEPSTTMNADEVVARGCALQCAILSPTFLVRDFTILDCQPYGITVSCDTKDDESKHEIFPKFHPIPFSKMLSFYRKEPFQINSYYSPTDQVSDSHKFIGSFKIKDVVPQANGEKSKLKIKLRVNIHGIFTVASASLVEKITADETIEMEVDKKGKKNEESNEEMSNSNNKNEAETEQSSKMDQEEEMNTDNNNKDVPIENGNLKSDSANEEIKEQANKKSKKVKLIDLPIEANVPQLSKEELNAYIEKENQMKAQDKLENERADAKNAVEEYVYEIRDKIYGPLEKFIKEEQRSQLSEMLDATENWLYEEGEDQKKQVYIDKLAKLKEFGQPILNRYHESQERPLAFNELGSLLQSLDKAVDLYQQKDEKYNHLEESEIEIIVKEVKEKRSWFDHHQNLQNQLQLYEDPIVTVSQIIVQKRSLESACYPILNKPKPKVEAAPPPPKEETTTSEESVTEGMETKPEKTEQTQKTDEKMEVD
ncbi:heat shock 70 kDa protein 4 isoform X1 [Octopus bimaculoides]|uniref:Heat shock 70 kDa protein 4L n=1 Tax=Octopus bimaculoides TaxID=37653 RepID=A0A0L8H7Z4_OCTBM|nr:heat shock 70 kDa protein 4 isoform X1 [Octopus bimaculoides]|eukprot:XP_014774714.1 PREDICTED: heat shock 70 kDa protein 4-like [Octopus bimaculoides]